MKFMVMLPPAHTHNVYPSLQFILAFSTVWMVQSTLYQSSIQLCTAVYTSWYSMTMSGGLCDTGNSHGLYGSSDNNVGS